MIYIFRCLTLFLPMAQGPTCKSKVLNITPSWSLRCSTKSAKSSVRFPFRHHKQYLSLLFTQAQSGRVLLPAPPSLASAATFLAPDLVSPVILSTSSVAAVRGDPPTRAG